MYAAAVSPFYTVRVFFFFYCVSRFRKCFACLDLELWLAAFECPFLAVSQFSKCQGCSLKDRSTQEPQHKSKECDTRTFHWYFCVDFSLGHVDFCFSSHHLVVTYLNHVSIYIRSEGRVSSVGTVIGLRAGQSRSSGSIHGKNKCYFSLPQSIYTCSVAHPSSARKTGAVSEVKRPEREADRLPMFSWRVQ
jgi:hypothetical protein